MSAILQHAADRGEIVDRAWVLVAGVGAAFVREFVDVLVLPAIWT